MRGWITGGIIAVVVLGAGAIITKPVWDKAPAPTVFATTGAQTGTATGTESGGKAQTNVNIVVPQTQTPVYMPPNLYDPIAKTANVASLSQREQPANGLPVQNPVLSAATNVLFIAPQDGVATMELHAIWSKLRPAPAVVWVGTTRAFAKRDWAAMGYKSDPLPSRQTVFEPRTWVSPAGYHRTPQGWESVLGLTKRDAANQWVGFFSD
jgi:hypothetical protein